jgi:hypothetical protein
MIILAALACFFALFALVMTLINLRCWQRAAPTTGTPNSPPTDLVTICIPARNEERNITSIVRSLLAGSHTEIEVLVYDDGSTDSTPTLLAQLAAQDPRVRSAATTPLPDGWNGKQHACWRMSQQARGPWMLFTDADVRFAPTAIANTLATAQRLNIPMVSGFPREIVGSLSEAMTIPMIFFILLSYLPFPRMRSTIDPGASAGCGQFLFIRRDAYDASGGHEGFKSSMHDGIKLPRAVRRAGMRTDLIDVTHECECRMYHNIHEVWRGFGKNAFEGLGSVGLLLFITLVHLLAHVAPWATLAWLGIQYVREGPLPARAGTLALLCAGAVMCALAQRIIILRRTAHPLWIAALHPVSVTFITVIQWWSYYLHLRGKREWKGRVASA